MGFSQAEAEAKKQAAQKANEQQANSAADNHVFGKVTNDIMASKLKNALDKTTYYDPGAAEYGGVNNGAEYYSKDAAQHMGDNDAQQASNRSAMGQALANMQEDRGPQYQEDMRLSSRADQDRNAQLQLLDMQRQAAMGGAPSAAAVQTRMGMNDIMAARAGAAGGARGLAALNGAQGAGAAQAGASASDLGMQGGMARSKEIQDALGMYGSTAGQVRQQDFNRLGASDRNTMGNAELNDAWKLGNANLAANQGKLGVAQGGMDQQWFGQSMEPYMRQFEHDQEMAALANGADADKAAAAIASARESRDAARNMAGGAITTGLTALGSLAGPAGAAAGGAAGGMLSSQIKRYA